jgi:hypothetical protein
VSVRETIGSQYYAALEMLRQAIVDCPEWLWAREHDQNAFWHIAYHVLFYTHLYLQPVEEAFVPWEKHRPANRSLGPDEEIVEAPEPYTKEEVLAYHALCGQEAERQVAALDLEAASGFYWLPFGKLELQFYNIRHIQQHTGELCERLWAEAGLEVGWVGMQRG